ncbi:MAG TPA: hypothetical protein VEP90_01570, partial [Methylomirabilota bacterium]|nr:hypothetical protein [Methylomirabilota bacterium]
DKYQLTDISEIDNIQKQKITYFSVKHHHHYHEEQPYRSELLELDLTPGSAWLYLSNNTDTYLLGVASQIDMIVSGKKSAQSVLSSPRVYFPGIVILFILATIFNFLPWKYSDHSVRSILFMSIATTPLVINTVWSIWCGYTLTKKHALIYLIRSTSKTNFLSRNRDQIILAFTVGIVCTVIASVVTAIIITSLIPKSP